VIYLRGRLTSHGNVSEGRFPTVFSLDPFDSMIQIAIANLRFPRQTEMTLELLLPSFPPFSQQYD